MKTNPSKLYLLFPLLFPSLISAQAIGSLRELPSNLGLGLRELVQLHRNRPAGMPRLDLHNKTIALDSVTGKPMLKGAFKRALVADSLDRVLVTVILDGAAPISAIAPQLRGLGGSIAVQDEEQANAFAAFVPLDSVADFASVPGVSLVKLTRMPHKRVGAVTSQGVQIIHSDIANATGITGQGITIGILSDSFDVASAKPQATDDVATGDLPNMGVPDGRPGLKFLSDGAGEGFGDGDEGRAMGQVAFDVAPGISLCFASVDFGTVAFAKSIRRLRTDSSCAADILVDDIAYEDEPMFSDGPVAKAIDDVVTSNTLAGRKVAYFASAGNEGQSGYSSNLRIVNDSDARAIANAGIDLTSVPSRIDTSGGFHNFNPNASGTPALYQSITIDPNSTVTLVVQWDDLFDTVPSAITTDLNILVFNTRGRYIGSIADDNFATNEPVEIADLFGGTYRLVVARTGRGSHVASRFRYVAFGDGLTGDYITAQQPTVFGHAAARNAQAVGAYVFDTGANSSTFTPALESYSSAGPVTIVFDSAGNRLATPEVRRKPDISAPDCVNTTFFANANTADPFFTFCGTSASAPHAAGAAALLLQAAGGPGSLSNDQIRARLQASADPRDLDPFFSQATLTGPAASLSITASGDDSNVSAFNPSFFHLTFQSATAGQTLTGLTIDLTPAGLNFDPSTQTGFPFTVGSSSAGITVTSPALAARATSLVLTFKGFTASGYLDFGIDRDLASTNVGGNSADLLAGAKVTATFSSGTALTGTFINAFGTGFGVNDGFGLINVQAALKAQ